MPESEIDLLYAIGLQPEEAIKYFKSKGYVFSWDWWETFQEAHAKAFTVAKCLRMDVLQDIRDMVQKAIDEGITFEQFKKELEPKLKAKGWWGQIMAGDEQGAKLVQLGSPWRLRTIYETNLQAAYMAGRYTEFMSNVDDRPYWMYVAIMDSRTRPAHAALNGKVFRYDDPFWDSFWPPNGWRCRCRVRALSEQNIRDRKLSVESSNGRLGTEDRLVSKQTGELREVTTYRDPMTGEEISPDAGWSYNPGKAAWNPDLDRYPQDVARKYIEVAVTGAAYTMFFEAKLEGSFPVAVLNEDFQKLINAQSQVISLSAETLAKNKLNHPELSIEDYQKLQKIIDESRVVIQKGEQFLVFVKKGEEYYFLVVKSTKDGRELYLTSYRLTNEEDIMNEMKKGEVIKNELF